MVLKPNMVVPGKKAPQQARVDEVAEATVRVLKNCVPAAVPGIAFLSGGQIGCRGDRASRCDQSFGPAAVDGHLLLWPGLAGGGAEGLGRQARECAGGAGGFRASGADEWARRARRMVGTARGGRLTPSRFRPNHRHAERRFSRFQSEV